MKQYLVERFSDDYYRLINQNGVRLARPQAEGNETFNTCWDGAISPDGTFYFTLSSEAGKFDHAKLVRYDYENNKIVDCFYAGNLILPNDRQLPASKLHTSINFMEDGRVIATTHTTDRARSHPEWMPVAYHNHAWEGFPGSHILVYDPKTGHSENWGIPVPHETIYGAKYDPIHRRLYMIGFLRGHVYCYDLNTKKVKDLGKAAELYCYRLVLGADNNIYACTKSGFYFRINTELNKLEDLNYTVEDLPGPGHYIHNTWYKYCTCGRNHPSGEFIYLTNLCADDMLKFNFKTQQFSKAGRMVPKDGLMAFPNEYTDHHCDTFILDKYGVIWYQYSLWNCMPTEDIRYRLPNCLMRWDIENGKEPELVGVLGTPDWVQSVTTEMEYDEERDILYSVDAGRGFGDNGPSVLAIDLAEFRKHLGEPGPLPVDDFLKPVPLTEEEKKKRDERNKVKAGEEVTANNPFQAFPIEACYPVRIWRHVPHTEIEEAAVIGMCYDDQDVLHVVCGNSGLFEQARFVFRIKGRDILDRKDFTALDAQYKAWLASHVLPQPFSFDPAIMLPEVTGRRYLAKASAVTAWNNDRQVVGTQDGLLAIVSADNTVFSLGNASAYGPVRCLCTNKAQNKLWGVSGDIDDMGYVFTYDDKHGLRQLGVINYNTHGYYGPTASNVLSSIVLNDQENTLAIGAADRTATVHVIDL
ncbi:MAG: hypothetical protein GX173_04170 [Ruminococcaceae bacterium]|nr:hypothetical protein [Oscillospiraceae bacterium]